MHGASVPQMWVAAPFFGFKFNMLQPSTRDGVVEYVAQVADSEGFVAFVLLANSFYISEVVEDDHFMTLRRQPDGSFLFHDTIYDTAIHLPESSALGVAAGWLFHFVSTSPRLGLGTHVWAVTTRQTVSIACGRGHVMRMLRMSASGR